MPSWIDYANESLNINLTDTQINAFEVFEAELLEWNSKFNLTAIRDAEGIRIKHFLDSLTCTLAFDASHFPTSLIDVGTGAGFPGIPIKILYPELKLTLVESVQKKARFCEHIIATLGLRDCIVLALRAEDVGQNVSHREKYSVAVGRAVAGFPVLAEYLLPLVKPGGMALMQKGSSAKSEAESSVRAIRKLGGDLKTIIPANLPGIEGDRFIVVINKNCHTPREYPRKAGTPNKSPLD